MNKFEISVVVPIYNVEMYVAKTIESIQKQNFGSYEIILVEDGSPDQSGKICDDFASKDRRIRVIHKKNGGVMSARFAGVDAAQGRFIAFLDGDDRMPPDALQNLYEAMVQNDVDYVNGVCVDIDENGNRINEIVYGTSFKGVLKGNDLYRKFISEHPKGLNMKLWKKEVLLSEPRVVVHPLIRNNEDFIFNLLLSSRINSIMSIDNIVAEIVCRPESASRARYGVDYWLNLLTWLDENYSRYNIYLDDLIQYKILTIWYKILWPLLSVDLSNHCFDNVRKSKYKKRYGLLGFVTIFYARHPNRFFLVVMRYVCALQGKIKSFTCGN